MKGLSGLGAFLLLLLLLVSTTTRGEVEDGNENNSEQTFEEVEKGLKKSVGSLLRYILPYLMDNGNQVNISVPCRTSILRVIGGVRQLREWAVRFVDATGKLPPGILEGTSFSTGDYDQCLDIKVGKKDDPPKTPEEVVFRGQYCLLEANRPDGINRGIKEYEAGNKNTSIAKTKTFLNLFVRYKHLTNSTFKLGVCVPSKCSKEDLESILQSESLRSLGKISVFYCKQNEEEETTPDMILLLCLFGIILGIMIIGTVIDVGLRLRMKEHMFKESSSTIKLLEQYSKHTSLYTNALEVLNTNPQESLRCLCGIRPIIVILIIYSHAYGHLHSLHFQKFSKPANFLKFFDSFTFAGIANGSVAVDSLFLIVGITITYPRWRYLTEKNKINLNIRRLLLLRYFRMSAGQLLTISLFLLLSLVGSGPFWIPYTSKHFENCHNNWWKNILFVNNFVPTSAVCLYHTWVLSVAMQFTVLSAFLIWILKRSFKLALFTMVVLTLAGMIGVGVVTVINKLPGSMAFFMLDSRNAPTAWRDVFILPYDHIGPFCVGLIAGYFLAVKKDKLHISRLMTVILWCSATACSCAVMFGLYGYRHGEAIDQSLATFYGIMHRNAWALSISWVIVACATKHGGAVGRVLCSNFFVPLDRLCFMAYLLHIPVIFFHSGMLRERMFMGHLDILFLGIGYNILSYLLSFIVHIIFVRPYFAIEDYVISYCQRKKKVCLETSTVPPSKTQAGELSSVTDAPLNGCINVAYSKKLDGL